MPLATTMTAVFDRYGDRPALAERRTIPRTNTQQHAMDADVRDAFETLTYTHLGARVRSVAAQLRGTHERQAPLPPGERLAMLGFASIDFTTVDLAANLAGIVTVPLQTSGTIAQADAILTETAPRAFAATIAQLGRATLLIAEHQGIDRLIVMDYRGGDPNHRQALDAATQALDIPVETLDLDRDATPNTPPSDETGSDLAMLLYTSGSTGTPKGAMYSARLVAQMWGGEGWSQFFAEDDDVVNFHYMPMSHLAGHSSVRSTLARGGATYFASTTNLSSFFEDLALCRPTELSLVPRVCELIYQEYQRLAGPEEPEADTAAQRHETTEAVLDELRTHVLGGRVRWASCTSAPVSAELKSFMEALLGIELHELYGTTEIGGVLADGRFLRPPVVDFRLDDVPDLGYFASDQPDARGELLVKSTSTVHGYYHRPDLDALIFTPDRYYRTGDIAAVDDQGHVRIIDRKNAIIKLSQGEFVALPSLEATYVAGSNEFHQVFLHGHSDQSSIVGVVVPRHTARPTAGQDDSDVAARMLHEFRAVAAAAQLHPSQIPSAILVETEPFSEANGLLSDHRKPVRPRLLETYGSRLAALYQERQSDSDALVRWLTAHGTENDTVSTVRSAVAAALHMDAAGIDPSDSYRDLGGDSLTAVYLSRLLDQIYSVRVPVDTIASESSRLRDLAEYIDAKRACGDRTVSVDEIHGPDARTLDASDLTLPRFMRQELPAPYRSQPPLATGAVLLTGASGYLGRYLCLELLRQVAGTDRRVACLIRARDTTAAREHLRAAFTTSGQLLAEFDMLSTNLEVIAGNFSEPQLGLDDRTWELLTENLSEIVHAGAMVNHVLPYGDLFAANVAGTAEIIRLALTGRIKPVTYMSSIATALLAGPTSPVAEDADIRQALPRIDVGGGIVDGYAATKWASEVLLRDAHERFGLPVTVFRASMILAHSHDRGQINVPDTFTRLLFSVARTGLAPATFYSHDGHRAHYDGLPVDVVAASIGALAATRPDGEYVTYHLVNPFDDGISLDTIVDWLVRLGVPVTRIGSYREWVGRFTTALHALGEDDKRASLLPLLDAWQTPASAEYGSLLDSSGFMKALASYSTGIVLDSLSEAFIEKCLTDIEHIFGRGLRPAAPVGACGGHAVRH